MKHFAHQNVIMNSTRSTVRLIITIIIVINLQSQNFKHIKYLTFKFGTGLSTYR